MLCLTLLAFAWRMDGLDRQSLWRDEIDAIWFATRDLPDTLAMFIQVAQNGPLYFLGLRPWFDWVGTSEIALRLPSVFASTLCIPLLWQVARRLIPPPSGIHAQANSAWRGPTWAAALAALLLAVNPYQLWYAQEGKMYALVTCLVLVATWYWWEGISKGGVRPWVFYWLAVTAGMYSHLLFILIFPLHFVWFWLAWPQSRYRWRGYGAALAGLTLPYLPMLLWQWRFLLAEEQVTLFRFTPLGDALYTIVMHHSQGFAPNLAPIALGPIFLLAVAGIALGWGEIGSRGTASEQLALQTLAPQLIDPWRRYLMLVCWVVVPVATIYLLSLRQPVFTDRYVLWIAPGLMMLLALGAVAIRTHALWLARGITLALVIYVLGFWLYAGMLQKTHPLKFELRQAVAYVAERRDADELLILQIPHLSWAYAYYTSDQGSRPFAGQEARLEPWQDGLWTNHHVDEADAWDDVQGQMQRATAGVDTLWLLRSEPEMWDSRRLLERWLDENGAIIDSADFAGVQARHYRIGN